jgi:hypothetical protein
VIRAAERDRRQALSPRLGDRQGNAVPRDDLAETLVSVETPFLSA